LNAPNVILPNSQAGSNNQVKRHQLLINRGIEISTIILLSITAMVTAFSAYQASRWGTNMSLKLGQANTRRVLASRADALAGQQATIDVNLFTNWLNAYAIGNEKLVQFYEERFRAEFIPAFQAWLAMDPKNNPNAPKSPFAMTEYQLSKSLEAQKLDEEAAQLNDEALLANDKRDGYALTTVLLASVLFFVGVSQRVKWFPLQIATVLVGLFIFLSAITWMIVLGYK
jgi:hypothetical protein